MKRNNSYSQLQSGCGLALAAAGLIAALSSNGTDTKMSLEAEEAAKEAARKARETNWIPPSDAEMEAFEKALLDGPKVPKPKAPK